jgi:hypothetical protein
VTELPATNLSALVPRRSHIAPSQWQRSGGDRAEKIVLEAQESESLDNKTQRTDMAPVSRAEKERKKSSPQGFPPRSLTIKPNLLVALCGFGRGFVPAFPHLFPSGCTER